MTPNATERESLNMRPIPEFLRKPSASRDATCSTSEVGVSQPSSKPLAQMSASPRPAKADDGEHIMEEMDYPIFVEPCDYPIIGRFDARRAKFKLPDRNICRWKWLNKYLNNLRNNCD